MKKLTSIFLAIAFLACSSTAFAEDTMQRTLRDSLYGGIIGALLGTAIVLLTDDPGDNIGYIPTGAAIGIIAGAAYGIGSSTTSAAEIDKDGTIKLSMPTISSEKIYDEKLDEVETIDKIDIVRLKF